MLNTDLHNPNMENKMSLENFVKNCRKINNGTDLPEQFLKDSYFEIKTQEIKTLQSRDLSREISVQKMHFLYQ